MKTSFRILPFAAALWLPTLSLAQTITSGLPGFISYQGRVLNSSGGLVGAGTPVNRTVTFRIWDHPSNTQASNLIYSETQTVTISEGEFSVLVGQGVANTATPFSYSETAKGPPAALIANAFNGSSRYLAVTVDDGTAAVDNEITPRQQVVSSAFAFRAKFAETLGTSTSTALTVVDSGNIGVGNPSPPSRFTITGSTTTSSSGAPQLLITDSADTNERLRIGLDSTGNGSGFLQSFKEGMGAQSLLLNPNGGFVGIGKTNPATSLDVNGVIRTYDGLTGPPQNGENGGPGQRLVLWPGTTNSTPFGFGMDGSTLWHGVPTNNVFKWYEGTVERMRLSLGNLGIGTTDTTGRLTVGENSGTVAGVNAGSIIVDHENSGGASSLVFRSKVNRSSDYGYLQYQDAATVGGTGESAVLTLGISNDSDDHIALMPSGSVGVGTTKPTHKLTVIGPVASKSTDDTFGYVGLQPGNGNQAGYIEWWKPEVPGYTFFSIFGPITIPTIPSARMAYMGWDKTNLTLNLESNSNFLVQNGNMSIGTTNTTKAKLMVAGGPSESGIRGAYINNTFAGNAVTHGAHTISIYADSTIVAGNTVIAASDERIKKIDGITNGEADLKSLLGIKVTDYHYKDAIAKGEVPQKKVIAQQLEQIFPQAVTKITDVVPDIYQPALLKDGWVQLATDLKKGDRVKLITAGESEVYNVLEVKKDKFRTDFDPKAKSAGNDKEIDEKIFVYGREVNDFRTVDYDAIAMLNVSATQELKKEMDLKVEALSVENAALRARIVDLEAGEEKRKARVADLDSREKARETRLAAIEKLLQNTEKTVLERGSLKSVK